MLSLRVLCVIKIISHPKQPWLFLPLRKAFLIWRFLAPFRANEILLECKTGSDIGAIFTYEMTNGQSLAGNCSKTLLSDCQQFPTNVFLIFFPEVHILHTTCEAHALWTPLQVLRSGEMMAGSQADHWRWMTFTWENLILKEKQQRQQQLLVGICKYWENSLADSRLDFTEKSPQRTEVALEFVQSSISAIWSQPSDSDYEHTPNGCCFSFMGLCFRAALCFRQRWKKPQNVSALFLICQVTWIIFIFKKDLFLGDAISLRKVVSVRIRGWCSWMSSFPITYIHFRFVDLVRALPTNEICRWNPAGYPKVVFCEKG